MSLCSTGLFNEIDQLRLLQALWEFDVDRQTVCEVSVRHLPVNRGFLVAAGLEQVLEFLEHVRFDDDDLHWLEETKQFNNEFLDYLEALHFTGDIDAVPEGTVVFSNEPLLLIRASYPETQLIKSRVLNLLHFQTLIASKAARAVIAAHGKPLFESGMNNSHGFEAAVFGARACFLSGFHGTTNVLASRQFSIPLVGKGLGHIVEGHVDKYSVLGRHARTSAVGLIFVLDELDPISSVHHVLRSASQLKHRGSHIAAVRFSGNNDLDFSRKIRALLDKYGFRDIKIYASGNLDEHAVEQQLRMNCPIDGFYLGASVITSADSPTLSMRCYVQEYDGRPQTRFSYGSWSYPCAKQIYRTCDQDGRILHDKVTVEDDHEKGSPLLISVMRHGRRIEAPISLTTIRNRAKQEILRCPTSRIYRSDDQHDPVEQSEVLKSIGRFVAHQPERSLA